MEQYQPRFTELYRYVKNLHAQSVTGERGHGLDHDVLVAEFARYICPVESLLDKVWVAGMLHSIDRMVDESEVEKTIREALLLVSQFTDTEREEVFQAVLRHSERNQDDQSPIQIVLMDADRLANLQMVIAIRAAQFRPNIPPLEIEYLDGQNPASTYRDPRSILDDLRHCIEWVGWLRIPKAKEMGGELEKNICSYIEKVAEPYELLGLAGKKL